MRVRGDLHAPGSICVLSCLSAQVSLQSSLVLHVSIFFFAFTVQSSTRSHTPALAMMMSCCSIFVPHADPGCHLSWLKPLSFSCPHGRAAFCWTMPSIMDVPHLPLASVLEVLGVTVAALLCVHWASRLSAPLIVWSMTSGLLPCFFTPPIKIVSDDCLDQACLASTRCRPFFNSVQGWRSLCLGLFCGSKIALSPIQAFQNLHTPPASSSKLLQTVGLLIRFWSPPLPWNLMMSHLISLTTSRSWTSRKLSPRHGLQSMLAWGCGAGRFGC